MFQYSACNASGGVAHVLCSTTRCCAYNKVSNFPVLQLKKCLGCGRFIGNLCLRVVLSAEHLVSSKGHIIHAWQQHKFCRLLLNILCGYSTGSGCVSLVRPASYTCGRESGKVPYVELSQSRIPIPWNVLTSR